MNLRHIEVFRAVVDCESFSGAAERLIMTQPAVSMQVQVVERHFGVQLLERRRRRAVLTEAGIAVYRWACEVLQGETETHQLLDELKHAERGRVVVGTGMTVGSYLLPPILSRFKRQHPEAEIVVRFGDWEAVCADLLSGAMDYGVLIARDLPVGLEMEIVGTDEMVFICAPAHHLANRARVSLAELASESFILAPKGSSYRRVIDDVLERYGLGGVSVHMELDGNEALKRGVLAGLGVGLGLRSAVGWEVEQGVVREVKIDSAPVSVDIGLLSGPHRRESPILEAFQRYFREQLRQYLSQGSSRPTEAAQPVGT
jgi:DNA-binding transcriptional LysR family regulator